MIEGVMRVRGGIQGAGVGRVQGELADRDRRELLLPFGLIMLLLVIVRRSR